MKKFQPTEVTIQSMQPITKQAKAKNMPLLELLPQITKILPTLQSFFQNQNNPPPQTQLQPNFLPSGYQRIQNKNAAISSMESHKKFVDKIKSGQ